MKMHLNRLLKHKKQRTVPKYKHSLQSKLLPQIKSTSYLWGLSTHKLKLNMSEEQKNNPLHGIKLVDILEFLVDKYGWETLAKEININCFKNDPSIKSSLTFLRKTPWARTKVEDLYLVSLPK